MKLERERDIPAFKGKTRRECIALRDRAKERDHWIIWLHIVICFFTVVPTLGWSRWLGVQFFPHHPFTAFVVIYFLLVYLVFTLLYALFITPRIRKALEPDVEPSA
jgi:polyferredoxin